MMKKSMLLLFFLGMVSFSLADDKREDEGEEKRADEGEEKRAAEEKRFIKELLPHLSGIIDSVANAIKG
uniref:Kasstasin n=1 Tax=Phlyctimantis maculatus TaxID=2517390 RepID=KASST_PHLMA|nr:RecName: Full=Kasstasin; Flags: Precursor [Kassina cochranae]CCA30519.1 kasstasin precursor [Kassina cochranae]